MTMTTRVQRTANSKNFKIWANSPNTQQFEHLIPSEQHGHQTVRTLKILKISEQGEQSEHLLFGLWWALVNDEPSLTDSVHPGIAQ